MNDPLKKLFGLNPFARLLLHVLGVVIGALLGAFIVFQILFLAKVLPHGGF